MPVNVLDGLDNYHVETSKGISSHESDATNESQILAGQHTVIASIYKY
jgi:hypothetical protein